MHIKNLNVSTRLGLGFGVVLLLLASIIGISIHYLASLHAGTTSIVTETYPKVLAAQKLMDTNNKVARSLRNALLLKDEARAAKEISTVAARRQEVDVAAKQLDDLVQSPAGQKLFDTMQAAYVPYSASIDEVIRLSHDRADIDKAVDFLLTDTRDKQLAYMAALDALIAHQSQSVDAAYRRSDGAYADSRNTLVALGVVALLVSIAAAFLLSRQLLGQLGGEPGYVAGIAGRIAAGDLAVAIDMRPGDGRSLLFAIRAMRDSLAGIVGQVRNGAEAILTAATEIANGNLDLSSRTEEQAGALEETASSMEELTATVKQNAENARNADGLAQSASAIAVQGGAVVANVVDTMQDINASARKIVDIISVIDGIAFQTNILALNAAVEAARAGEQGRGFAVVASEVRMLAHRSASAAKEIKLLIDDSVSKVDTGTKLVGDAGATMERIVTAVKSVTDIIADISSASQEQEAGIGQINHAISEMDAVTQQNAALVEQAAAAAGAQQEQAQHLSELVGVFKLDDAGIHGSAPAAPGPRTRSAAQPRIGHRAI